MKILKFGAVWCKECLAMKPVFNEIETEISELETEYYEADESPEVLKKYEVQNIPEFIFFDKNEKEFLRLKGIQNKDELIKIIKENLNK